MADPKNVQETIENFLLRLIPLVGSALADMTPEQKRAFLLLLAEAIARGAAEGAVRGNKDKTV
jgi:uncharacterized SAM-dependent methyltransferase